jgi:general secretion pathway protein G
MTIIKKNSAFTLVEILIVLIIIAFLFAFLGPRIMRYTGQMNISKTKLKMEKIKEGLMLYKQNMGHYPSKKEGGLRALLEKPNVSGAAEKWTGPYIDGEDDLIDSWESPFEYNAPPVKYGKDFHYFEIISVGRAEKEEGAEIPTGY